MGASADGDRLRDDQRGERDQRLDEALQPGGERGDGENNGRSEAHEIIVGRGEAKVASVSG